MEFQLKGEIKYDRGGAGNEGSEEILDFVDADSLEQAITLSRAFIKSRERRLLNGRAHYIQTLEATLFDENEIARYKFELIKDTVLNTSEMRKPGSNGTRIVTIIKVIEPEHLAEKYL